MTPFSTGTPQPDYPEGALDHLGRSDPVLGGLIEQYGVVTRDRSRPPFYALVAAIVGQQISVKAAAAILSRLLDLFPDRQSLSAPALAALSHEQLRAVGLSAAKASYIHDLADKIATGAIDLGRLPQMADEEVIDALVQVKGIGRWTAEMFLIFSLGRLDVLAVDDLGLRAGVQRAYSLAQLPKPAEVRAIAEPWRPYRTIATIYIWEQLHNAPLETRGAA